MPKGIYYRKPNKISIDRDTCKIYLQNGEFTIIDTEDYNKVKHLIWTCSVMGYATHMRSRLYLHHLILGRKEGLHTDHINRDKLDNRKSNLRFVTREQNMRNCKMKKNNTSGVTGVRYFIGKWVARIYRNHKEIHLGRFSNKEDAINARRVAELKYV